MQVQLDISFSNLTELSMTVANFPIHEARRKENKVLINK